MANHVITVRINELRLTNDGYGDATLQGILFDGIGYEEDQATGQILALTGFWQGKLHGPQRTWSANGQMESEEYNRYGGLHGPVREWDESGRLRLFGYCWYGVGIRRWSWDEHGQLVSERLAPDLDVAERMQKQLAERDHGITDIDLQTWEFVERPWGWGGRPDELPPPCPPPLRPHIPIAGTP